MKLYSITKHDREDMQHLRNIRRECVFSIINRGKLWYDTLTDKQVRELKIWYEAWLSMPDTGIIPTPPLWLESQVEYEINSDKQRELKEGS